MPSTDDVVEYITGVGRNPGETKLNHHYYAVMRDGDYLPMCRFGWNRSDGESFSILRGWTGERGLCRVCRKRMAAGLPPVEAKPTKRKTKWL